MKSILKKLGNPQDSYKVLHIAWTNGKWSTCQMISQVLRKEFGHKVGLTISPHLVKLNERIQVNGVYISNEDLNEYLWKIYTLTKKENISLSFFEHMILVAFLHFRDQKVEYAVIEVGLGGKYDATNVFAHPLATLITTISHDHNRLLWSTLTQIFRNKAGILKKNSPCFTRLNTPLMHYAAKIKWASLYVAKNLTPTNLAWTYQQQNAGLAFHCLTTLGRDPERVTHWLMHISNPWRTQWLAENILLDWAHNEEWVIVFGNYVASIRHTFKKIITIFWSTKTREEYPLFFSQLIEGEINYVVIPPIEHRAVDPITYQHHLSFATTIWPTLETIWQDIPRHDKDTLIIIYGSLYLAGEFLHLYEYSVLEKKQ